MTDVAGRTAIVTGASRGIGLAIARRLAADGANIVITGRKPEGLEQAAAALATDADRLLTVAGRADDESHQSATITAALERFGAVDYLVNNAGINPSYGPLRDLDLAAARKIVEVNDLAAISWTRKVAAASPALRAVVNISSIAALTPPAGIGFYGASKAMLAALTRQFALELAPTIRVNAVAPAVIKTRFAAALYEGREEAAAAQYPLGRLGEVEDVAGPVAFLLSDDASWITGQTLVIDGGALLTGGIE